MVNPIKRLRRWAWIAAIGLIYLTLLGCGEQNTDSNGGQADLGEGQNAVPRSEKSPRPRYLDDLDQMKSRGEIRVIIQRWEGLSQLPRQGLPDAIYKEMASEFVNQLGLDIRWVSIKEFDQLIAALNRGEGDLIATNLTINPKRNEQVAFTLPVTQVREILVVPSDSKYQRVDAINGATLGLRPGTTYITSAERLQAKYPQLKIQLLDRDIDPDSLLDLMIAGRFDATLMDNNTAEAIAAYRDDIKLLDQVSEVENIGWAVRQSNPELLNAVNEFLTASLIRQDQNKAQKRNLAQIKKSKTLRVITQNNPASYFIWRGELMGFEYDLAKLFAKRLGVKLEVIVPPNDEALLDWLAAGYGDVVAASYTITDERKAKGFKFSRYYNEVEEVVIAASAQPKVNSLPDLADREFVVKENSSYWQKLKSLQNQGGAFNLTPAPAWMGSMDIIDAIARDEFDLTLVDSHIAAIENTYRDDIAINFALSEKVRHGWVVRKENAALLAEINGFFNKQYRGLLFNIAYNKYFRDEKKIQSIQAEKVSLSEGLSPYDEIVKQNAELYGFDWRLITSQMYQESQFNPNAKSFAGALGLLQVMPRTARELGYQPKELVKPKVGIEAGVKYLAWSMERFEETLSLQNRIWFALAAYNAGFGHVQDARRIARQQGWNPDIWFEHVEKAMLLLSRPQYAKQSRFGYCRGSEPVAYVREIHNLYQAYLTL